MGSLAITLCHLAAGRLDGVVSLKAARSVDIAAAQPLDLEGRSRVVAAGNDELCARLAAALTG
jgi:fructose-1,6-bisphosphatase/inositol monophosphatase family enzyme